MTNKDFAVILLDHLKTLEDLRKRLDGVFEADVGFFDEVEGNMEDQILTILEIPPDNTLETADFDKQIFDIGEKTFCRDAFTSLIFEWVDDTVPASEVIEAIERQLKDFENEV